MNSLDLKQRVTQKAERYKFAGASDEEKSRKTGSGWSGVTPVFRTLDLGHIPQAVEPLFVLGGGLVTQRRVHACPIVEGLDVVEHRQAGSFA